MKTNGVLTDSSNSVCQHKEERNTTIIKQYNKEESKSFYLSSKHWRIKNTGEKEYSFCFICFGEPCFCGRIEGYEPHNGIPVVSLNLKELRYLQSENESSNEWRSGEKRVNNCLL